MNCYIHVRTLCMYINIHKFTYCIFARFIGQGEFGEVFQGTAIDILGPETGPHPVAIKVCPLYT